MADARRGGARRVALGERRCGAHGERRARATSADGARALPALRIENPEGNAKIARALQSAAAAISCAKAHCKGDRDCYRVPTAGSLMR